MFKQLLLMSAVLIGSVQVSSAAIIVVVGNGTGQLNSVQVTAGDTVSIPFAIYADTPTDLTSYDIAIDFNGDGDGFDAASSSFSGFSVTPISGGFNTDGSVNFTTSTAQGNDAFPGTNYDFLVSDGASSTTLPSPSGTALGLFNLNFNTALGTALGIYDVEFVVSTNGFGDSPIGPGTQSSFVTTPAVQPFAAENGSFEITAAAVPEPGSMLALAGVFAAGGIRQLRRKKRA
ncbi:PEP-CTERM sorting domain-containing protein [Rhodopirellula sp. P2]|uniref:PEP-CTERM sorting domain-containing protein n=1 Tax=Rhodopirellula sp. P2 TaxID=2127060 RepID=UPI002368412D|nr:PEP-CTERM sorting domain-containing protein [Rhodopirellula sp. P2]WDQ16952.1 PEP-CTERM sorting domain-containing protein [Rhodopirellula sp. P2]